MSYILDALKKSEQERGHGNIPDVQTVHSSSLHYRSEKKAYWPYVLVTAVILNLLAIVYFIANKQNPVNTETSVQTPANIEAEKIIVSPSPEVPEKPDNTAVTVKDEVKTTADKSTEIKKVAAGTPAKTVKQEVKIKKNPKPAYERNDETSTNSRPEIIEFYDLPESITQALPAIIISAHVYSTNPAQRSVVINNNFMEEGEYVLDGLILYEITRDGAIFIYQGTLFNYGVVSGWQ